MPWTEITRLHYRREGLRYASDATDTEWSLIEPLMPAANSIGRPRKTNVREVVNALFYIASTGCQWRQLPKEFPPYSTVQGYFYPWSRDGTWLTINHALVVMARENEGRQASPTAGVIDSQSVKPRKVAVRAVMMRARRSRDARGTSLPIRLDISLVCRCILLTSKIGTVLFLSSAQSARSIRGSATSSLTAPMRATSSRTPCPNSAPGPLKSSNDPIPRKASRFCRVDGLSRERSHGSIDAAGSPRTSRPPSQAPLHGSSSPMSAA